MWGEENGKGKKEMGNLLGNPFSFIIIRCLRLDAHTFAIEVEHFKNGIFISGLVDTNISDLFQ